MGVGDVIWWWGRECGGGWGCDMMVGEGCGEGWRVI